VSGCGPAEAEGDSRITLVVPGTVDNIKKVGASGGGLGDCAGSLGGFVGWVARSTGAVKDGLQLQRACIVSCMFGRL
jgi:hypothetical protein